MPPSKTRQPEPEFTDLEIRIFPALADGYPVELTLRGQEEFPRGLLDAGMATWTASGDAEKDGSELFAALFRDPRLAGGWAEARGRAAKRRVRLRIDPAAAELHVLPWEQIRDGQELLAASAATPFSRYLPIALPWGGLVEERPIRILVVIANPADLQSKYNLAPIDIALQHSVIEQGLADLGRDVQIDYLEENVTLEALEARLRDGEGYHVVHYIGHGAYSVKRAQAVLYMQGQDGATALVKDEELVQMLAHLPVRPQLIFLVACQSAVRDSGDAFRGLGPRLVEAGVPAVVAMQDFVAIETARKLTGTFYSRLCEHGQVDCALNEARATLLTAGRSDAAVPVLFMRLKSGQLWSEEADARGAVLGTGGRPKVFWSGLDFQLKQENIVPILGPRIHGQWLPSSADIARKWAAEYEYPFGNREDLARVAQYIATSSGEDPLRGAYLDLLMEEFTARLPQDLRPKKRAKTLSEMVKLSGWRELAAGYPNEVHRVVASLGMPLYLTTNVDPLLSEALSAAGRSPTRDYCRWNPDLDEPGATYTSGEEESEEEGNFTAEAPLVYHLFGTDEVVESLVISEDEYFRYLYEISSTRERIPNTIRGKLACSLLMFVGFSLYDWEFRVLMNGLIKNLKNSKNIRHVAVQLEESDIAAGQLDSVQSFLETYFSEAKINVYWGSTNQFVAELREFLDNRRA